ncbi:MAG: hypothetical protein WCJ30_05580 [Deltaproteobacteria bacterium]
MPYLLAIASQTPDVRWIPPPRGSLRHGVVWITHPRVAVAAVLVLVVAILAVAIARRVRRK